MTADISERVSVGLETATNRLSVAAARGGNTDPVEFTLEGARRHAGALLPLLERALAALHAAPADIGLVALSDGPGSFTGLRVGAAVAKALAAEGGAEVRTVPSLLVRATPHAAAGQRVLALSDALRGEAFAGVWDFGADGRIDTVVPPSAVSLEQLRRFPPVQLAVGEAPVAMRAELQQRGLTLLGPAWPSAVTLLALCRRPGGERRVDPEGWEPDYGRPAEAQARWERSHGRPLPNPAGDAA